MNYLSRGRTFGKSDSRRFLENRGRTGYNSGRDPPKTFLLLIQPKENRHESNLDLPRGVVDRRRFAHPRRRQALAPAAEAKKAAANRVFELRTYTTNPGKLDDLHKRFRDDTCRIFKKHGMELVGFWTPEEEKDGKGNTLVYMLAFPSRDAAKKAWKDFGDDPEWKKVYAESHKNGVLVSKVQSVYLDPTDYSEIK